MKDIYTEAKSGFSLTELLIIIAIVLVLAAILVPMFAHTRNTLFRSTEPFQMFWTEKHARCTQQQKILLRSSQNRSDR
jgi:prepilin-type N-terminal cleavage/methylation domain-containing protein